MLLVLFALAAVFFVALTLSPLKSGFADAPDRGPGDIELYRAEVDRIRAGESYYDAAASELRSRGYPTRKLFNWRMPLPMWLIGKLPDVSLAKGLLCLATVALICLSFCLLEDEAGSARPFSVRFCSRAFCYPACWAICSSFPNCGRAC